MHGTIVVSSNRLHTLVDSHYNHKEQEPDTVGNAIGAHRHVTTVFHQCRIDEDDDDAGAGVHS